MIRRVAVAAVVLLVVGGLYGCFQPSMDRVVAISGPVVIDRNNSEDSVINVNAEIKVWGPQFDQDWSSVEIASYHWRSDDGQSYDSTYDQGDDSWLDNAWFISFPTPGPHEIQLYVEYVDGLKSSTSVIGLYVNHPPNIGAWGGEIDYIDEYEEYYSAKDKRGIILPMNIEGALFYSKEHKYFVIDLRANDWEGKIASATLQMDDIIVYMAEDVYDCEETLYFMAPQIPRIIFTVFDAGGASMAQEIILDNWMW